MPELIERNELFAEAIKLPSSSCMQLTRQTTDPDLQSPRASANAYCPAARKQLIAVLEESWIQNAFPILHSVAQFHDDDIYCLWRSCEGLIDVLTFSLRRFITHNTPLPSIEALGAAIVASRVTPNRRLPSLSVIQTSSTRSPTCLSPIDGTSSGRSVQHNRKGSSSEHVSPIHRTTPSIDAVRLPAVRARSISITTKPPGLESTTYAPSTLPPVLLPSSPNLTRRRASTSPQNQIDERSPTGARSPATGSPSHHHHTHAHSHQKREFHRSLMSIPSMGDEEKQQNDQPTLEDRIVTFLLSPDGSTLLQSDHCSSALVNVESIKPCLGKHSHITTGALFLAMRSMSRSVSYSSLESLFDVVYRHANRTFIIDLLRCSAIFDDCHARIELTNRELEALAALNVVHLKQTVALMDGANVKLGKSSPVDELIDIVTRSYAA